MSTCALPQAVARVQVLAVVGSEDPRVVGIHDLDGLIPGVEIVVIDGATQAMDGTHHWSRFIEAVRRHLKTN